MKLFQAELYKIVSKKVIWIGLAGIILFMGFYTWGQITSTRTEIQGKVYTGLEAIQMDREITKEFEGVFTMEKAKEIIGRFGFSGYDEEGYITGNFCSRFVTKHMTKFMQTGEKPVQFETYEWGMPYGGELLTGEVRFGYTEGWEDLNETVMILLILLGVLQIIATVPVFSDEYMQKTADVILTTVHGKGRDILAKAGAAMFFNGLIYVLCFAALFFTTLIVYGTEGLLAGSQIIGLYDMHTSILVFFLLYFAAGFLSALLNTSITLAISASCRHSFLAVIIAAVIYFLPFAYNRVFIQLLTPNLFTRVLGGFLRWLPIYLPLWWGLGVLRASWKIIKVIFIMFLFAVTITHTFRKYKNYQAM